jgi:cellulose biosynthesis protein BcsQ
LVEALGDVNHIKPIDAGNGLYVMPGDIRLAEFEQELGAMWADCFQRKLKGFRGVTALSLLVNQVCRELAIDYVFYDSGPNIGPLNRVILLDSDYFIIPAACDLFSVRALKTLGHTLVSWIRDWQTILDLAPDIYLLPGRPVLLGYVPQRFKVYAGTYTAEYAEMLPQVEKAIYADVVTLLQRVDSALSPFSVSDLRIGEVKDYASLAAAAQRQGTSIYQVDAGTQAQRDDAWSTFKEIAQRLVARTV